MRNGERKLNLYPAPYRRFSLGKASYPLFLSGLGKKPDCGLGSCGKLGFDFWAGLARSNLSFFIASSRRFFARLFMKRLYRRRNRSLQGGSDTPFITVGATSLIRETRGFLVVLLTP